MFLCADTETIPVLSLRCKQILVQLKSHYTSGNKLSAFTYSMLSRFVQTDGCRSIGNFQEQRFINRKNRQIQYCTPQF